MESSAISTLSMMANTASLQNTVSTAVLSMGLDDFEVMSEQMIKMMEQSVTPHLGQHFDMTV